MKGGTGFSKDELALMKKAIDSDKVVVSEVDDDHYEPAFTTEVTTIGNSAYTKY